MTVAPGACGHVMGAQGSAIGFPADGAARPPLCEAGGIPAWQFPIGEQPGKGKGKGKW